MAVAISRMSRKEKLLLELYKPRPPSLVIGKEIDRGAYGVVLEGTFEGRRVAIKKVHKILTDAAVTDEEVERLIRDFKKETDMLKSIRHPHVVQALGAFYDPKTREPILVMEKMAKNLRKYLEENKGLKELKQIHICLQIALGVQFLHHLTPPLAHRDLTDKNVLIADDGTVKIGDLGQSKYKDLKDVYFDTEAPGAFFFMAPETTKPSGSDKAHYTESVDIFSLGVLALEIATQSGPTPSLHGLGILLEVKRRESDLKKMSDGHPLKSLVLKCLENNYKKRPVITQIVDNLVVLIVEDYTGNTELLAKLDEADEDRIKLRNENTGLSGEVTELRENMDVEREKCEDLRKQLQNVSDEMGRIKRYSKRLEQGLDGFEDILTDKKHQNLQLEGKINDLQNDMESHQKTVAQKEVQIEQRDGVIMQLKTQVYELMEENNKLEAQNNLLEANANAIRHIVKSDVAEAESQNKAAYSQQHMATTKDVKNSFGTKPKPSFPSRIYKESPTSPGSKFSPSPPSAGNLKKLADPGSTSQLGMLSGKTKATEKPYPPKRDYGRSQSERPPGQRNITKPGSRGRQLKGMSKGTITEDDQHTPDKQ